MARRVGNWRVRHVNAAARRRLKRYSPPLRRKKTFAHLGVNGRTEHPFELEEDVWQREEIVTTGVGFGVAIPHTKSQWIRHSSISIARLVKPVDWQSEMGEVELVIMLTLGANEGMNHVKVFSQLARKLVNKNFRQSLFAAQDAQSILTLLETELTF
ncbi:hypothetical protein GKF31_20340 [Escherichia coli]|uniref:Uncharacterized protein n=1 Tax=Escherichia coli TaxID=562 RepID=A0A641GZI8_ECOLX|nr:hypothetical protein EA219_19980 [Escherichia coli]KAA2074374.1 hypothetical protein EA432_19920 [Escherichia coli]MDI4342212.1 hypothetical protein [Escherichia coli]MSG91187.1 hypothetical protein [Escherichia coli]MSH33813.1 hypothetical protein [Escherichia coli]